MPRIFSLEELSSLVGREIGSSPWLRIDQERINRFADCTDDHQWIHVDPRKAAAGPYGRTVAHGFLLLALIPALSQGVYSLPDEVVTTINYGINRTRFLQPVPVGSEIRDTLRLKALTDKGDGKILLTIEHTLHIRGEDKPACIVEMLRLLMTSSEYTNGF